MQALHYLVPDHAEGVETDIAFKLTAETTEDAEDLFVDAKDRLLAVTDWAQFGGFDVIHFRLADSNGHIVRRHARRGDHILISVGGDGSQPIEEFDSFTIDALEYDDYPDTGTETFAIRMHPSGQAAVAEGTKQDTATIVIKRKGNDLAAIYHGRNKTTGAKDLWHGLETTHWEALMSGMLDYFD